MATVNSVDVNGTSYDIEDTEARNGVSALKTENKTTKDNISDTDQIMIRDTTEKKDKLIDYDKLADAILTKITSKQFTLDQGSKTLVQALNELNSNALRSIDVDYDNITIDNTGFANLASKMPQTGTVCMATIKYYGSIVPINAINVYATSNASYVFGEPNTTINKLIVRYWYTK